MKVACECIIKTNKRCEDQGLRIRTIDNSKGINIPFIEIEHVGNGIDLTKSQSFTTIVDINYCPFCGVRIQLAIDNNWIKEIDGI